MEILEHKEMPFPDDLEGRLNAVLNIVNTELKSATLLVLDDSHAEGNEVRARIRGLVGKCYLPFSFESYCHNSLFPIGAVAEEVIRREGAEDISLAYSLTEAGKRYGRPIAALALQYAVDNNLSLYQILGATNSRGKTRAPLSRVKILKLLSKNKGLRMIDLINETDLEEPIVLSALEDLKNIRFVDYDSVGEMQKGRGSIVYKWIEGKSIEVVNPVGKRTDLTKEVARLLKDVREITIPVAAASLGNMNPIYVSMIYSGLVKQGFAVRERGFIGRVIQSRATIRDEAANFLEFEREVEDILSGKASSQEAEEKHTRLIAKSDYEELLRNAINLYTSISRHINCKPFEERTEEILELLRKNPGRRPVEMKRILGYKDPWYHLKTLLKSGTLRVEKQGRESRYYINE